MKIFITTSKTGKTITEQDVKLFVAVWQKCTGVKWKGTFEKVFQNTYRSEVGNYILELGIPLYDKNLYRCTLRPNEDKNENPPVESFHAEAKRVQEFVRVIPKNLAREKKNLLLTMKNLKARRNALGW